MRSNWSGRIGLIALVIGVSGGSGLAVGCAAERDPINRVQPNALPKSFFLGENLQDYKDDPEFRTKTYNIDSAANTDSYAGTIGGASAVERIRWEVTENMLFARRAYQESPGADDRGLPRKEVSPGQWEFPSGPNGTIVAAYKILSHFDIRRDYNSSTGEQTNVIVENSSDRPWNEREYMRVDWSKNEAESTSGDTSWIFGQDTSVTAVEYSATNPDDVDAPHFETDTGYFDITNKYQLKSEPMAGFGISECVLIGYFNGSTSFDCTPTEVKVRASYVRLTGNEDFEPFEESKAQRDIVGNWGNAGNSMNREYGGPPITAWDPQYGYTDAQTKTFYAIHNVWEKSHQQVACHDNTDDDKDGTADVCDNTVTHYKGSKGSQCDVHIGKCTIPVRDRPVKTNAYWLNIDAPQDLTDAVSSDGKKITTPGAIEENTVTWNQLLKQAVATRREVECRRTGDGDRATCHAQFFDDGTDMVAFGGWGINKVKEQKVDNGKPVVATCHNPVRAYDLELCGKPGETIRLGDIRKNYAIYWPYASRAPYGGVATIGGDPLTGEMLGVTATIMMRSATMAAAQQRDIIQLALGDIAVDDIMQGNQASRYAGLVKNGKIVDGMAKAKTDEEIANLVKNVNFADIQAAVGETPANNALSAADRQLKAAKLRSISSPQTASIVAADQTVANLIGKLDSSEFKSAIANRGLLKLVAQSADKSTDVYNALSTFASMDNTKIQTLLDQYQMYLGSRGICFSDPTQAAGAGTIYQASLAPYYKDLYGDLDKNERGLKIYQDLLRESIKGIAFHEIGHSLGLRHNFSSSWDAMNYAPQYWQLRTNEGQSTAKCTAARNGGEDTCMGPRYLDPYTDDEQGVASEPRPGIEYFANTSTMEYQIERFGETVGAGTYDLHAMETLYGRSLQTFDSDQVKPQDQQFFALKMLSQGISSDLVLDPKKGYGMHYTRTATTAKVFDPARDCRAATDEEKAAAKWRIVHGKVCAPPPKNHLAYEDMISGPISFTIGKQSTSIGVDGVRWSGVDETGGKLIRWPFRYGEDYSRGGYIHAKMFDSGADVYEITMNVQRRFEATYPWAYFRRQNKEFAWWNIPDGIANNTLSRIRAYHWNTATDIGRSDPSGLEDDDQQRPDVMANAEMFNFLQRILLMPEPGTYGPGADTGRRTSTRPGAQTVFDLLTEQEATSKAPIGQLGIVDGRFVQVDFDNSRGGSWDYNSYVRHAGFDEEKVRALIEMVDSRPTLSTVSRDNALDGRDPYISFRTDLPHAVDRFVGAILSEDWETIAPSMNADGVTTSVFSLVDRDPSKLVRPAGNKGIVFPNMGYQNELGTGIYAMLYSRFSTDMTLATKMRIRLEGDAGPMPVAGKRMSFVDPTTGYRYVATRFGTENIPGRGAVELGVASRMLQRANELLGNAYENTGLVNADGELELKLTNGQPTVKANGGADQAQVLRRYIGLLDGMRQVGNIFGGGPLGGGGNE
ncbi:hypothetical protein AKJ09_04708 [Labilithrix luteola]|uniref:EcxA zinc-binding domain-containing protein n=1 Tax=Labilithrix luteola TaxID=1391654 RepID=A0A0K1PY19_9BACT|nr:zinc-dependent metalloprotease [Labilithrix luteola]AKU98044.1 hypothetical protein AKJ09_04708 [Labilithrix luteola]